MNAGGNTGLAIAHQPVTVEVDSVLLDGYLSVPTDAFGVVLFAHGSGSSRHSPRNRAVADLLNEGGLATLLIDLLTEASADYLVRQFEAGADAVQIFDTWAGILPADEFRKWCIEPCARIAAAVRRRLPDARIIGFPRGAGAQLDAYLNAVAVDAIGLDWTVAPATARDHIQKRRPVQGNLDPLALLAGGKALDRSTDAILGALTPGPFIFNLGHGVLPQTPIAHVERLVALVRGAAA